MFVLFSKQYKKIHPYIFNNFNHLEICKHPALLENKTTN